MAQSRVTFTDAKSKERMSEQSMNLGLGRNPAASANSRTMSMWDAGEAAQKLDQISAKELFHLADQDKDNAINYEEFHRLYDVMHHAIHADIEARRRAERSTAVAKRKTRVLGFVGIILTIVLALSATINALTMYAIVDSQIDTRTDAEARPLPSSLSLHTHTRPSHTQLRAGDGSSTL
jgi:hypothetical protein